MPNDSWAKKKERIPLLHREVKTTRWVGLGLAEEKISPRFFLLLSPSRLSPLHHQHNGRSYRTWVASVKADASRRVEREGKTSFTRRILLRLKVGVDRKVRKRKKQTNNAREFIIVRTTLLRKSVGVNVRFFASVFETWNVDFG